LDSFDDRYLGTKTSDPTLDNDGNALAAGALYFSTTENVMKVYDGASWITATSAGATSLLRFRYVATSGQATFSGADAAAATLTYTVNNIAVHRNGVTLDTSEYTASNGTSIVLNVAAGTGDIIDIIAFKSFTVADALSAVSGGTVNGAVTITGVTTVQAGTASLPAITTTGDTNTGIFFPAADTIAFSEGGVESMRIDSSGNVGIGTASPAKRLSVVNATDATTVGTNSVMTVQAGSSLNSVAEIGFSYGSWGGTNPIASMGYQITSNAGVGAGALTFSTRSVTTDTAPSERMRINSDGNLLVGTTSGASLITASKNQSGNTSIINATNTNNTAGNFAYGANLGANCNTNTSAHFAGASGGSAWYLLGNGTTTYTSDSRLKKNVETARNGYLEDLCQLRVVKYNWANHDDSSPKELGLIAQEVEQVFPGLVQDDLRGEYEGVTYKTLKGSVIPMLLLKAIQEQQTLITQLQADVAALKGNA
jgi:hypothetical protein